jgi:apolipoprotein N-acyltransferase
LDFSAYISQIGKESVDILLVPAYDWEAVTPYHAHMAAFAAIQYGVHMVRANGKGITAFYDTRGNIRTQSNTFTSVAKVTFAEVPLTRVTTVYSVIGDRFVHVLLLFLLILTGLRFLKRVDI